MLAFFPRTYHIKANCNDMARIISWRKAFKQCKSAALEDEQFYSLLRIQTIKCFSTTGCKAEQKV